MRKRPGHSIAAVATIGSIVVLILVVVAVILIGNLKRGAPSTDANVDLQAPTAVVRCPDLDGSDVTDGARAIASEIVLCPTEFDGVHVRYLGEVVGDVLRRRGGAWVQVNDDAYALAVGPLPGAGTYQGMSRGISVWLPDPLPDLIDAPGGPGERGTVLDIAGVVERNDRQDGGGLTLRAIDAEVFSPAVELAQPFYFEQFIVAVLFGLIAIGMIVLERMKARDR